MQYVYNLLFECCFLKELGITRQPTVILHLQSQGKDVIYEQWSVLTFLFMTGRQRLSTVNTGKYTTVSNIEDCVKY